MLHAYYDCNKNVMFKCSNAVNDSTIFLDNQEQNENEEYELVWLLYRQLSGWPRAAQTHLESTLFL